MYLQIFSLVISVVGVINIGRVASIFNHKIAILAITKVTWAHLTVTVNSYQRLKLLPAHQDIQNIQALCRLRHC